MFENLSSDVKNEKLDKRLETSITKHLQSFKTEFKQYFPESKKQEAAFVRNPFSTTLDNYKANVAIFKMIRPRMILSRK